MKETQFRCAVKHVGWASAGVLVAVLLFFATRSGAKPTRHTPPAPVVEVTSVQQKGVPVYGEWIGTLREITNSIDAGISPRTSDRCAST